MTRPERFELLPPDSSVAAPLTEPSACAPAQSPIGTFGRAIAVRFAWDISETGASEEIRTPDPQIRSLVRTVEIIEVRYRKKLVGCGST